MNPASLPRMFATDNNWWLRSQSCRMHCICMIDLNLPHATEAAFAPNYCIMDVDYANPTATPPIITAADDGVPDCRLNEAISRAFRPYWDSSDAANLRRNSDGAAEIDSRVLAQRRLL